MLARANGQAQETALTTDVEVLVDGLLRERRDAFAEKRLRVECACECAVAVAAPRTVLAVVIGNLLRAATQFAECGTLRVRLDAAALSVAYESAAAEADAAPPRARADSREPLGLGMIQRVCERCGWRLEESAETHRHAFVLRFG